MSANKAMQILNVGLVLLFLFISILIGVFLSYKKADSADFIKVKDSLSFKREHLEFKHDLNLLKKINAQCFDKYHIMLNQYLDTRLDLLTIANHTRHRCESGKIDGCWTKEADVYKNDSIAVQIHYHNTSPISLDSVSFGITRQYTQNSIKMEIVAKVKNKVIAKDIVKAYLHGCNRFNILEGQGDWTIHNEKEIIKHIDEIKFLVKDKNFSIGKLLSDEQGSIIVRFRAIMK